jgi:cell division protein FtsL
VSLVDAPVRPVRTSGAAALATAPVRRPAPRPAPVPEVRPRHLRVVAPAERVRRRLTPAAGVLLTGLIFVTLFLIAIAHTLLVQGQIHLDDLDAQLTTEQARYQELRTEVAEMESPERIVAAAEAMGMVSPQDLVYLQPTTPDPADGSTALGSDGPGATGGVQSGTDETWSAVKPLLETPAP